MRETPYALALSWGLLSLGCGQTSDDPAVTPDAAAIPGVAEESPASCTMPSDCDGSDPTGRWRFEESCIAEERILRLEGCPTSELRLLEAEASGSMEFRDGRITSESILRAVMQLTVPSSCMGGTCMELEAALIEAEALEDDPEVSADIGCAQGANACVCDMELESPGPYTSGVPYTEDGGRVRVSGLDGETVTYEVCVQGDRLTLLEDEEILLRLTRMPDG